jgi:tripartite-type tricarboxylate transporter receptor subunit TctC
VAALPGVPTAAEAGMPASTGGTWAALVAPARTPPEVLARIGADIAAALRDGLADALAARGVEPQSADPVVTAGFLDAERAKWAAIAQRAGVRPD